MGKGTLLGAAAALAVAGAWLLLLRPAGEHRATRIAQESRHSGEAAPPGGASPAEEPSGGASPRADAVAVVGRVVDERRFPVAGAVASVLRLGDPALSATTDADGRFRVEGVSRPPAGEGWDACLRVRDPDGRAAQRTVSFSREGSGVVDAGTLVVRQPSSLDCRVLDSGSPISGARVCLGTVAGWILEARSGADGVARFEDLPKGTVHLLAIAEAPRRVGRATVEVAPGGPAEVALDLVPARTVDVMVVAAASGRPLPGATFGVRCKREEPGRGYHISLVPPLPQVAPADAEGRTRIEGTHPEDTLAIVDARAPGFDTAGYRQWTTVEPGATEAQVELVGPRTVRIPVRTGNPGEAPVPPDGAAIALLGMPGSKDLDPAGRACMEGTMLVIREASASGFLALARAPDGSQARVVVMPVSHEREPTAISFRQPLSVEVLARSPDGTPAAGIAFVVLGEGAAPLVPPTATDAEGRVAFVVPSFLSPTLFLLPSTASPWGGRRVAELPADAATSTVEVTVGRPISFLARVTVDGEARLPPDFFVLVNGIRIFDLVEDPERGEIRFEHALDPRARTAGVALHAYPFVAAEAEVSPVPEDGPVETALALRSAGEVSVSFRPPADRRFRLCLQRWDPVENAWREGEDPGPGPNVWIAPDGTARAEHMREGRYRIVECETGVATEPVEVPSGGAAAAGTLDFSGAGWARGRIVAPEGADLTRASVLLQGPGILPSSEIPSPGFGGFGPTEAPPAGIFAVRVPGDRPVTLRPTHPLLVPAAEGGTCVLTEPREGIVLRMETGTLATMRLDTEPKLPFWGPHGERVLLFRGEPAGEPVADHPAVLEGDRLTFGGFAPGRWTLLVDFPVDGPEGFAPAILRDVALGEGTTDLGEVALGHGSRLRFRVLVKEKVPVPQVHLSAIRLDPPRYTRFTQSYGAREFTLGGLGPGRFRILGSGIDEIREVDGVNDLEATIDLR